VARPTTNERYQRAHSSWKCPLPADGDQIQFGGGGVRDLLLGATRCAETALTAAPGSAHQDSADALRAPSHVRPHPCRLARL
jgi:hypothetical protein